MALTNAFIHRTTWLVGFALQLVVVTIIAGIMAVTSSVVLRVSTFAVAAVIVVPISAFAFNSGGYWIDFVVPVMAASISSAMVGRVEQWRVHTAFARYVSPEIMRRIVRDGLTFAGERREATILFADLRGFTAMSETMNPEVVAAQLNEWLDAMTRAIFRHRGMVNDFIGDAVMAIFNAPVDDPQHALHAGRAALAMNASLKVLNAKWIAQGRRELVMGIGIHTGVVFAGNVGGQKRLKYTLVGDAVNLAARVEGVNRELHTSILITEATRDRLSNALPTRPVGAVTVRGRNEAVALHELLSSGGEE
jgi:adenylate cyclase